MERITIDVTRTKGSRTVRVSVHQSAGDSALFAYSRPTQRVTCTHEFSLDATCAFELERAIVRALQNANPLLPF